MRSGAVALVFGTRPELVKLAPLVARARRRLRHRPHRPALRPALLADIARELGARAARPPAATVGAAARSTARSATRSPRSATRSRDLAPAVVVVQGDTNSTARRRARRVRPRPARSCTSRPGCAASTARCPRSTTASSSTTSPTCCCAPTETARAHLLAEGCDPARVIVTGNTVVDAVRIAASRRRDDRGACSTATASTADAYVLATFHRPENVDDPERLRGDPRAARDDPAAGRADRPPPDTRPRRARGHRARRAGRCAPSTRSATATSSRSSRRARSS